MRITLLIPDLSGGGAERAAISLATEFSEQGHSVSFLVMNLQGSLLSEVAENFVLETLQSPRNYTALIPLLKYLNKNRPEVLISYMPIANALAGYAKLLSSHRFIAIGTEHNPKSLTLHPSKKMIRNLMRPLIMQGYRSLDGIIAVSAGIQGLLVEKIGRGLATTTIANPISIEDIKTLSGVVDQSISPSVFDDKKLIVAVGRLVDEKCFDLLIEAIELTRREVDIQCIILGEGILRKGLEAEISKRHLDNVVQMPGHTTNPWYWMKKADVFVLSSKHEGFGLVLAEALVLDIPIVSTDCEYGPKEILRDGTYGWLVPVSDVEKLSKAILKAIASPLLHEERERGSHRYSSKVIARQYLSFMDEISQRKG
tara:strand:- start:14588 stop:15697 length:1110 start_codon:yes stop_codon:yes gene_type:complete